MRRCPALCPLRLVRPWFALSWKSWPLGHGHRWLAARGLAARRNRRLKWDMGQRCKCQPRLLVALLAPRLVELALRLARALPKM